MSGRAARTGPIGNEQSAGRPLRRPRLARWSAHSLLALALLALAAWAPAGPAATLAFAAPATPPQPSGTGAPATLEAEAARLLDALARLRGLPNPGPAPRVVVQTRDARRQFVIGEFRRKFPASRLDAERRALAAWGLIPSGFDLGRLLTDLIVEQAAAYYDPTRKVMVLANWLDWEGQQDALAHELVHALQDRQIDLDRFLTLSPGRSDATLARQALVEGEAVALVVDWTLGQQGQGLATLPDVARLQAAMEASPTGPVLARAPRFIRALLTFPYAQGLAFLHHFRRRHGWAELSRLYHDPPRSTTHILHPELFFDRREDPVPVTLPSLRSNLGAAARPLVEDEAGEFGLTQVLREYLGESAAADGWRGDRYALWHVAGRRAMLVARTAWASEPLARAFAGSYRRLVTVKHGLGSPGTSLPALTVWHAGAAAFLVEQRDREVLLVERAPPGSLDQVRRAIWHAAPTDPAGSPATVGSQPQKRRRAAALGGGGP